MRFRALVSLALLFPTLAVAKDKKQVLLPAYVLRARTVLVLIDPDAGIALSDPHANETARDDVEKALMKWGRLTPVMNNQAADLVITVRKGNGKLVEPTIGDPRINNRPGVIQPTDGGIRVGAQRGPQPPYDDGPGSAGNGPHPQTEVGSTDDAFVVYEGGVSAPLDGPPAWRYIEKNALRSPSVPAVDVFRKAIEAAEKQANKP